MAEADMAMLYFHCVGTQGALLDRSGSDMNDVCDARARAFQIIQTIVAACRSSATLSSRVRRSSLF
jgi:hypothetical protein